MILIHYGKIGYKSNKLVESIKHRHNIYFT